MRRVGSRDDAVRITISLGGDSDTPACITGGIAETYYDLISPPILDKVKACLTTELWKITEQFYRTYVKDQSNPADSVDS